MQGGIWRRRFLRSAVILAHFRRSAAMDAFSLPSFPEMEANVEILIAQQRLLDFIAQLMIRFGSAVVIGEFPQLEEVLKCAILEHGETVLPTSEALRSLILMTAPYFNDALLSSIEELMKKNCQAGMELFNFALQGRTFGETSPEPPMEEQGTAMEIKATRVALLTAENLDFNRTENILLALETLGNVLQYGRVSLKLSDFAGITSSAMGMLYSDCGDLRGAAQELAALATAPDCPLEPGSGSPAL